MLRILLTLIALPLFASSAFAADPKPLTAEQTAFFENKIRPVLVEHCYTCHGDKKDKGGLRLDTREATLKGGDTGPAVIPGNPDKSLLVKAVKYTDPHMQMPPKGKLTPEQIAALTTWVKEGAPDPRTTAGTPNVDPYDFKKLLTAAPAHWAFQPVKQPALPKVTGVSNPVDAFLLAKLGDNGLSLATPADKRTLIRRATFDLHGVPPTPEEVEAFEKDTSPNAYEALLDKLLRSPRYGERWGRHWLDVARYADNQGGIFGGQGVYPFAWTYRDYVIRAFNEDLPLDRFVMEQLAADLLPAKPGDNRHLAALGFMTVGRKPDGAVNDDVIDDRIDTLSRGFLGLTAGCARCHDHKLEPIATIDYYGLYGVFKSIKDPDVLPVLEPQADTPNAQKFKAENDKARTTAVEVNARVTPLTLIEVRSRVGEYLLSVHEAGGKTTYQNPKAKDDVIKKKLHEYIHNSVAQQWAAWVKGKPAVFAPWEEFAKLPTEGFAAKAKPLAESLATNADKKLNPLVAKAFGGKPPESLAEVAKRYTDLFVAVDTAWHMKAADDLKKLAVPEAADATVAGSQFAPNVIARFYKLEQSITLDGDEEKLRLLLTQSKSPFAPAANQFGGSRLYSKESQDSVTKAANAITALDSHPGAPARAMIVQEVKPYNGHAFVRGNPRIQGAPAPRAFFTALSGPERKPFSATASGRLELAKAIVDPANPLTARVFVNRVWAWHFGKGIVGSASDFGFRGEKPTHPELLDYLASRFVSEGWSVKKLHKLIMLSAAYRQSSRSVDATATGTKTDPDNRLLWKMPLRKLEFEAYRDSILAVAGRLDGTEGGKPVDIAQPTMLRRTVYSFVDRKTLPNLFRSFDFPDPNFSSGSRTSTTLPPQALFLMNSPFVLENAKALAASVKPMSAADKPAAVKKLYRVVFQREATPAEIERALKFLELYPANDVVVPEATTWSYGFADYDDKSKKVTTFTPLAFAGNIVKGVKIGNIDLTGLEIGPDGGKAAKVKAACRRWTAPDDGKVDIAAELSHTAPMGMGMGDGVLCRVVSNRSGLLGEWSAANESVPTKLKAIDVKKGDTIDFLTFSKSDPTGNTFKWAPTITMPERQMAALPGTMMKWDAKTHFLDTSKLPAPLGPWEELAQVLLLSNEFAIAE